MEPFVGEIKMFAGNFAPRGWAFCDGQLLAVSQNDALFSLLGTIYGGDGRTSFGLPDMRGRVPLHQGAGPGMSHRSIGAKSGAEKHTLAADQLPTHNHVFQASVSPADSGYPAAAVVADTDTDAMYYNPDLGPAAPDIAFPDETLSTDGNTSPQPHDNIMPFQCVNYIIALTGIYPSRT